MNIYRKLVAYLQLRNAIRQADEAHEKTGERYYVMPTHGTSGKPTLVIVDRRNFRKLKFKKYISHYVHVRDLVRESFYFTPYRNGNRAITEEYKKRKCKQYYAWYEAEHCFCKS